MSYRVTMVCPQFKEIELDKGVFIISIDLELAWGFNYELLKGSRTAEKYLKIIKERSRRNVRKLLELSKKFKVPFTWGIVGHLFLSSCDCSEKGLPHPAMPRPNVEVNKDWYSNDPCTDVNSDPLWYGSDIIKEILNSNIEHEIACHSFSHVDFSKCSREIAQSEIRKCKEVMKDFGVKPRSFIFPKNRINHLDILKQEDFKVFRYKIKQSSSFLLSTLPETTSTLTASHIQDSGLVGIPSYLLFQSPHAAVSLRLMVASYWGLERAVAEKEIFHITMHDYLETDYLFGALSKVLLYATKLRNKGKLDAITMYDYYEKLIL